MNKFAKQIIYFFSLNLCVFLSLTSSAQTLKIDSLEALLKTVQELNIADTSRINILNELAGELIGQRQIDKAMNYLQEAKKRAEELNYKMGIAASLTFIGIIYSDKSDFGKALENYFQAMKIRKETGDKKGTATVLNKIGIVFSLQSEYAIALDYCFKGLKLREETGDKGGIWSSMTTIGNIYISQRDYAKALECFSRGLKMQIELKNKQGISNAMVSLGMAYFYMDKFDKALENYFNSMKIKEETGDKYGITQLLNNIGIIYQNEKKYSSALEYFLKELKIQEELSNKNGMAYSFTGMGSVYEEERDYQNALKCFLKAGELYQETGLKSGLSDSYFLTGNIYVDLHRYQKAIECYIKSITYAKEINSKEKMRYGYLTISDTYKKKYNYKEAYEYHLLFSALEDSIRGNQITNRIAGMEVQYETEKKEKEIESLAQKNKILLQQNEIQNLQLSHNRYVLIGFGIGALLIAVIALLSVSQNRLRTRQEKMALEQKLLRTQMNPHFIFNSLTAIQNYIYTHPPSEAAKYISSFAALMRRTLESSRQENVSIENEIATLRYYMELQQLRFRNKFDYRIEVSPDIDTGFISVPPMLAQPLIENSIEHGIMNKEEGKGLITVRFALKENMLEMEVEDNGIGREKAKEIKLKSEEKRNHVSLATSITEDRIALLNKKQKQKQKISFTITDLKDVNDKALGTKVSLRFPEA